MRWLLDTSVISETTKRSPSRDVMGWVNDQPLERLYTLSLACAEIRAGIVLVSDSARRTALEDWLTHKVRPLFGPRILEVDEEVWVAALRILDRLKAKRRTAPLTDLIFAAAAERHELVVVTRNIKHFAGTGVAVLNPWVTAPRAESA